MIEGFARNMIDPRMTRFALGFLDDDYPVEPWRCPECERVTYVDVRVPFWCCNTCGKMTNAWSEINSPASPEDGAYP